nr:MAG: ORF1 [Torque teno midi virus]
MPFWWKRRNKFWFHRKPYFQKRRRKWKRPRYRRRRFTRRTTYRRRKPRRRRRQKVRRKRKTITLKQWQPDSIVNCKIKGGGLLVMGAEGKQFVCYTNNKQENTPAKVPAGGGFGVEVYSLQYLYEEYRFHRNIWTKTNIFKDLCRYLRCKFHFYRHQYTDFLIAYERQPPFTIDKYTFPSCHPFMLLQSKHKKIILSKQSKTNGKIYKTIHIRPPKQMINKWFFTSDFSKAHLGLIKGSAANFNYAYLGGKNDNDLATLISLNIEFYQNGNWGQQKGGTDYYKPYNAIPQSITYKYYKGSTETTDTLNPTTYAASVAMTTGFFKPTFLQAFQINNGSVAHIPCTFLRYNPNTDDGKGNKIWLSSSLTTSYDPPTHDDILVAEGLPMWLMLYGWLDYIKTMKHEDPGYLKSYYLVMQSPSFTTLGGASTQTKHVIIDRTFFEGKAPYRGILTDSQKKFYYPLIQNQLESINTIVETGPYIPKYSQETYSSWELKYTYSFYFKWGGPQITDPKIEDPEKQPTYPVPDKLSKRIQIQNPENQIPESILQAWDYRRGFIKSSAIKRIRENTKTDSDFEPDSISEPQKKKIRWGAQLRHPQEKEEKIEKCLQELCKENIYQEETQEDLQQLIKQQQQQQFLLKRNLLELLSDLKTKQRALQLQTGLFN